MMTIRDIKYIVISALVAITALTSCIDDDLILCDSDVPEEIRKGYSLSFIVTLDKMGGTNATRSTSIEATKLEEMENYIDPEKFRLLFFASDDDNTSEEDKDVFLFESKGRWVKRQDTSSDHSSWFVSVPMFDYGNDTEYNWDWDKIREYITTHKFKIAILANHPNVEWNMGIVKKNDEGKNLPGDSPEEFLTQNGWLNNSRPHWGQNNTKWGNNKKKIFDLHHCQYDPIYDGKNYDSSSLEDHGVYDFITEKIVENDDDDTDEVKHVGKPKLSATSSWVSWGTNDDDKEEDANGNKYRHWIHPSKEHPIPMYGIQEFEPIPADSWKKGTIFTLEGNSISLLRSVVKLELALPKGINPNYVAIFFPNIYARCEPMDIWTPTNKIWKDDHSTTTGESRCDWFDIINYGVITAGGSDEPTGAYGKEGYNPTLSKSTYQKRMSWFYGAWKEKGWHFGSLGAENVVPETDGKYPSIFNTCIQRNTAVLCRSTKNEDYVKVDYNDNYDHWVVYCGERNINDPSNLLAMGLSGSGNPTVIYWMIGISNVNGSEGRSYVIPFIDYSQVTNSTELLELMTPYSTGDKKEVAEVYFDAPAGNSLMNRYEKYVQNKETSDWSTRTYPKPWPLLRNHVYTFKIDGISGEADPVEYMHCDFTKLGGDNSITVYDSSDEDNTIENLKEDAKNSSGIWTEVLNTDGSIKGWSNKANVSVSKKLLTANSKTIKETEYLRFEVDETKDKRINFEYDVFDDERKTYYLRIEKECTIIFPRMTKGQILTISGKVPVTNNTTTRPITLVDEAKNFEYVGDPDMLTSDNENGPYCFLGDNVSGSKGTYTFSWRVTSNSVLPKIELGSVGGIGFTEIKIETPADVETTRASRNGTGTNIMIKSENLYSETIQFE